MKYRTYFSAFLLLFSYLCSAENGSEDGNFEQLFDTSDDLFILEAEANPATMTTRAIIPINDIIALITDPNGLIPIELQNLLQNPLYKYTFPPIQRDIIDMPMFQQFTERARDAMTFTFKPFITRTFKEYFDYTSTDINSYIDLQQNAFKRQIDQLVQAVEMPELLEQYPINSMLDPFRRAFLQEFRTGAMFEFIKDSYDWSISFRIPLYYLEHNLNLPEKDQLTLKTDPLFAPAEPVDEETAAELEWQFARKHLISDRFGVGDTRLNVEWVVADRRLLLFSVGLRATLPTSFPFKKGLIGQNFSYQQGAPNVDLYSDFIEPLISTFTDQNIPLDIKNTTEFFEAVIDRLSTMLLETSLGNRHHLGIGVFTHNKMKFTDQLTLSTLNSVEMVLPAHEYRYYNILAPASAFEAFNWADTSPVTGDLAAKYVFLNQQFINYFFPACYDTVVFPGFIVQNTSCLRYEGRRLTFMGGTDLWWHTREWLFHIDAPESSLTAIEKEKATQGYAYQSMVWIGFEGRVRPESAWKLGFKGEVTVNSFGVGDEWGASLYVQKQF